ncbi:MAG: hypothetical protein ACLFSY_00500 [Desulfonatronovibrionaceae bacterium]
MFKKISAYVNRIRARRSARKSISPREFQRLAEELMQLADVAERVVPDNGVFGTRVQKIKQEMHKLNELAGRKEFGRLPRETRLELIKGLRQSRRQLVETMHLADPPTDTVQ